ncbi:arsenite efflux MFS transporter ArsK [Kaistia adipata]|uniref:arsenite efflux MFS transporter ArsK n=1 Tax=Kaistia adipata TaxID=166954 RepID=UPI00040F6B59|nr:arsenite efflux MFS transporter ArsK [Kaistia adipata]
MIRPVSAVLALGLTQIIGYGTLYYSFSVLAPGMGREFALSTEWMFAAFSVSLLASGLCAPWIGAWIDRAGAGRVMTVGSLVAGLALGASALAVNSVMLVLGLIAIQIASALVQYTSSFTLLVQINPVRAQRTITQLTLIAGFSSTLFWPFTTALGERMDWHHVYMVYAALHLVICLPIHAWLTVRTRQRGASSAELDPAIATSPSVAGVVGDAQRPRAFGLMLIGFAIQSFVTSTFLVHMLPMLSGLGLAQASVLVASVFGPAQVLSRFTNMMFAGRLSQRSLAIIASLFLPLATGILLMTAPSLAGAFAFAIVFGLSSGLASIVQGTLPLELFGSDGYGKRLGRLTSVRLVVSSAAPFAFALMTERLGIPEALSIIAGLGTVAVIAFLAIGPLLATRRDNGPGAQT